MAKLSKCSLILFLLFFVGFLFVNFLPLVASAQNQPTIYFFYSPTCSVCAREVKLINYLENEYSALAVKRIDVSTVEGYNLLKFFYEKYQVSQNQRGATPMTVIEAEGIGGKYLVGYSERLDQLIEDYIKELIELNGGIPIMDDNSHINDGGEVDSDAIDVGSTSTAADIISSVGTVDDSNENIELPTRDKVSLPFINEINLSGLSPLALSAVLGGLDGFNACAMVALGFLLAIILGGDAISRRKVILIGGTFIFVSGLIYFLFISAWLNLFVFLGYLRIITIIVGVVVVLFSLFLLKDYFSGVVCKLCDVPQDGKEGRLTKWQRQLFAIMAKVTDSTMPLWLVLVTVVLVAAGINMIELFCSFGFPVAYTKILTEFNLPPTSYYFYLLVYVGFYMLDDFLIFLVAVITLRVTKVSEKYLKVVKLISGLALLLLGLAILFRPELLSLK